MGRTLSRVRALLLTLAAVVATNYAISFASGVPVRPESPRPKATILDSGVPVRPESPRPKQDLPDSGVPVRPESPRP